MTGLVLATLLTTSPGIQLADNLGGRTIRLVDDDAPAASPLDGMTRDQLRVELLRLQDSRPGLGAGIALLAVGAALLIPGAVVTIVGAGLLVASLATRVSMGIGIVVGAVVLGVGVIMAGVGVVLLIVGGITLATKIRARTLNGREQDEVRRRLDNLDNNGFPPPQAVPPEVPQASRMAPAAMQTVFTF